MASRVAIVGAGIGGLTAAALLARAGHDVVVVERSVELRPVGAGLLLQPTGRAVLDHIGVGGEVAAHGARVDRLFGTTRRGRTVLSLRYADLREGLHGLGVQRGLLHATLLASARAAGARVWAGMAVDDIDERDDRVGLRLSDGATSGPWDVVIVADGARSTLRRHAGEVRRAAPYPWGALWFVAKSTPGFAGTLRQVYDGTTRMIGVLPTGRLGEGSDDTVSVFWSIRRDDWTGPDAIDLGAWKRAAWSVCPDARPLLDQVTTADQLIFAPYFDVELRQRSKRVVAIGDAAHATSPQLGQGANLALVDAAVLVEAFADASVPEAVAAFARARRSPTRYYRVVSRWLTPWFQSDLSALSIPRDLFMGPACAFPPTRRQMLLALAGVKAGFLQSNRLP